MTGWIKAAPASFYIKTNMCSIYEVRPADCAGFPHLNKKPVTDYMYIHHQNIEYCPATYKFVEKLKERMLLEKILVKKIAFQIEKWYWPMDINFKAGKHLQSIKIQAFYFFLYWLIKYQTV